MGSSSVCILHDRSFLEQVCQNRRQRMLSWPTYFFRSINHGNQRPATQILFLVYHRPLQIHTKSTQHAPKHIIQHSFQIKTISGLLTKAKDTMAENDQRFLKQI